MTDIIFQMDDNLSEKSSDELFTQSSVSVTKTMETVTNSCVSQLYDESLERRELLETLVGVSEMLSIAAILCGNLFACIKQSRKNQRKGKHKREETDGFDFQVCKNLLTKVSDCIRDLDEALNKVSLKNDISNMPSEVIFHWTLLVIIFFTPNNDFFFQVKALTTNDGDVGVKFVIVEKKIKESYCASIQEIRQFLQDKQTYVTTLVSQSNTNALKS